MKEQIEKIILDYQNDINEYLQSDIGSENHQFDIDHKLSMMKGEIFQLFNNNTQIHTDSNGINSLM